MALFIADHHDDHGPDDDGDTLDFANVIGTTRSSSPPSQRCTKRTRDQYQPAHQAGQPNRDNVADGTDAPPPTRRKTTPRHNTLTSLHILKASLHKQGIVPISTSTAPPPAFLHTSDVHHHHPHHPHYHRGSRATHLPEHRGVGGAGHHTAGGYHTTHDTITAGVTAATVPYPLPPLSQLHHEIVAFAASALPLPQVCLFMFVCLFVSERVSERVSGCEYTIDKQTCMVGACSITT